MFQFIADIFASVINTNLLNLFTSMSFNMVKKSAKPDGGIRISLNLDYPRETGKMIYDG
jgi:hypothetical protein